MFVMYTKDDLQNLLKITGWTPTELAAQCKCCESTVRKWMCGLREPKGALLELLRLTVEKVEAGTGQKVKVSPEDAAANPMAGRNRRPRRMAVMGNGHHKR